MGASKKKRGRALFGRLTAMKVTCGVIGILGMIALVGLLACQKTAGVRRSTGAAEQPKGTAAAQTAGEIAAAPALLDSQCVHCHPQQPETIAANGKKHKTEVGCMDCHVEHPPQGADAVPECSMCHEGEPHYDLEKRGSCHPDTHAPLDLKMHGEITGPCLTCHKQQGDEVHAHPSAHRCCRPRCRGNDIRRPCHIFPGNRRDICRDILAKGAG